MESQHNPQTSQDLAEEIIREYKIKYEEDKKRSWFYSPQSNFPAKKRSLENIIRHSLAGGTFFFGTNRTYDILRDKKKWVDENENALPSSPPVFQQCWNFVFQRVRKNKTDINDEMKNINYGIDQEIQRQKRSFWDGKTVKIAALEKLKSLLNSGQDIGDMLEQASREPFPSCKWFENETVEKKIDGKWVAVIHEAFKQPTLQDVLTWRQFRWNFFSSDSGGFYKDLCDKYCSDLIPCQK